MCKVYEGADVKTSSDLQNLITSVILRQTSQFSINTIQELINKKLLGSDYAGKPEVKNRCKDTIAKLNLINCIRKEGEEMYRLTMSFPAGGWDN